METEVWCNINMVTFRRVRSFWGDQQMVRYSFHMFALKSNPGVTL